MITFSAHDTNGKVTATPKTALAEKVLSSLGGQFGFRKFGTNPAYFGKMERLVALRNAIKQAAPTCKLFLTQRLKGVILSQRRWLEEQVALVHERIENLPTGGRVPYDYQVEDVIKLSMAKSAINALEVGSGKTPEMLLTLPRDCKAIVLCPVSMKGTWVNEIKAWRPDLTWFVPKTGKDFRMPNLNEVVIISHSSLPKLQAEDLKNEFTLEYFFSKKNLGPNFVLIADEAQAFTKLKAQRTQRYRKASWNVLQNGGRSYAVSGTPLKNKPPELWCLCMNLKLCDEIFGTWEHFCHLMGGFQGNYGMEWSGQIDSSVGDLLAPVMVARDKAEIWADMPSINFQNIAVELSDKSIARSLDKLAQALGFSDDISSEELLERYTNLLQQDLRQAGELMTLRKHIAQLKYSACLEIIDQYAEEEVPLVVASYHRDPVIELGMRKGWGAIYGEQSEKKRQQAIEEFQAGKLRGIALTIGAGGTGITLTRAHHMLVIDLDYVPANNEQLYARIHRRGQEKPCFYKIATLDHPLEARIDEILSLKNQMISSAIGGAKKSAKIRHTRKDTLKTLFSVVGEVQ